MCAAKSIRDLKSVLWGAASVLSFAATLYYTLALFSAPASPVYDAPGRVGPYQAVETL